jgi:hypothetical protein
MPVRDADDQRASSRRISSDFVLRSKPCSAAKRGGIRKLQRDKFPRWNVLDSAHLDLLYESILRFDIRRIRSFTPPGLREAGETRFDLSNRNGVGGSAPADKELLYLSRDPAPSGSRQLEDSRSGGKRRPLAAQAHSPTGHAITVPSRSRACQAYRAGYSAELKFRAQGRA